MLALVVDSSAGLTRDEAWELGATVVPHTFVLDGKRCAERYAGANGDYDGALRAGRVTGSGAVAAEAFIALFRELTARGNDVLCITISGKLSLTHRHACEAADLVRAELLDAAGATSLEASSHMARRAGGLPRIAVLDSRFGISCVEFLARTARKLDRAGAGLDEVLAALEAQRLDQGICFCATNIEALRATGRAAQIPQSVNVVLNRLPVLEVRGGAVSFVRMARGTQAIVDELVERVPRDGERELVVTHFGARGQLACELERRLREAFAQADMRVKDGGPVLSYVLGAGSASVTWGPRRG